MYQFLLRLFRSTALGFFVAGALLFPVLHDKYFTILFTLGIAAVLYGLESILWLGHINVCSANLLSFADSKCTDYSVRSYGFLLSCIFFAWFTYRNESRERSTADARWVPNDEMSDDVPVPVPSSHGELIAAPEHEPLNSQDVQALFLLLDNFRRVSTDGTARYNADLIAKFARSVVKPWRRATPQGHLTSSAWVLDNTHTHAVLVHHRKLGRWLQPGGHIDDADASWRAAAEREAREETGLQRFLPHATEDALFDVDVHAIPARGDEASHTHYDLRFLLIAEVDAERVGDLQTNVDESHDCKWFALTDLSADLTLEPSIRRMVELSLQRYPAVS